MSQLPEHVAGNGQAGNGNGRRAQQSWTQRVIVCSLSACSLLSLASIAWLALSGHDCPPGLAALGAACIGALASALSPARPG